MFELYPRHLVPPLIAFAVIASLPAPADGGRATSGCGVAQVADPGLRLSFEQGERRQSAAAAKACAIYHNIVAR